MAFFVTSAGHVHCSIVPQPVPKICPQHLRSPGVWLEQRAQPSSSTSLRERASLNVESAGTEADPRVAPTCLDVLGNGTSVDEANAGIFVAAVPGSVPCPLGSDAHIQPLLSLKQRRARTERRRYGDRDRSVRVGSGNLGIPCELCRKLDSRSAVTAVRQARRYQFGARRRDALERRRLLVDARRHVRLDGVVLERRVGECGISV
jgi:hypothetical protein